MIGSVKSCMKNKEHSKNGINYYTGAIVPGLCFLYNCTLPVKMNIGYGKEQ